ncbi:hypothetical protein V6N13_040071 [Hibiscus sabdariffa]|uniref:Uncharacterized protein n=1 Tax=Hibiscus sabdariffa TaxID=183260 RepID=A0ABR2SUG3_9ROSI
MVFTSGSVVSSIVGFLHESLWVELDVGKLVVSMPKVAFPQFSDQATNAKFINANVWGTGVRILTKNKQCGVGSKCWDLCILRLRRIDNGLEIGFGGYRDDWLCGMVEMS